MTVIDFTYRDAARRDVLEDIRALYAEQRACILADRQLRSSAPFPATKLVYEADERARRQVCHDLYRLYRAHRPHRPWRAYDRLTPLEQRLVDGDR
jgi:hypothetical protein